MALKKLDVVTITEEMIDQVRSGSADPMVTIPPSMVTEYANPTQRITAAFTDRNNDYWRYHLGLADGYLKAYESVKSELARLDKSANPEVIEARAQALMSSLSGQKGWRFNQYCDHEGNFQVRPGLGIIASALGRAD